MGLEGEFWFSLGFVPVSGSHFPSAKCRGVFLSITNSSTNALQSQICLSL